MVVIHKPKIQVLVRMTLVRGLFVRRGIIAQLLGAVLMERSALESKLALMPQILNAQMTLPAVRQAVPYAR